MRTAITLASAIAICAAFSGCVANPAPLDPDIVALVPPQTVAMDALLVGTLVIDEDCVYIDATEVAPEYERVLPLFPSDIVHWDGGTLVILDEPYDDGDLVFIGGGFVAELTSSGRFPADTHIPTGCVTDYAFQVAPALG